MTSNPHLIARLSFVDRFVVGSPPIGSDFRAECDFGLAEMRNMVRVELEVPSPTPHEATARIWLLCPELQAGRLSEGLAFSVHAGPAFVAHGRIVSVLDGGLRSVA